MINALFTIFLCLMVCIKPLHAKPVELVFWHGLAGHLGEEVRLLASDFNQSQTQYLLKPVYKGGYIETLTSFAAAYRAHKPPALVQVFEVGTAMMMAPQGVIKPVADIMKEQSMTLPIDSFFPPVRELYSQNKKLMAMPFNLSAPVMYYNRDALAKLGYESTNFPRTWEEMDVLAHKLKKAGYACVYTTAYPGWILLESFLAIHGLPIIQGEPFRATFNTPPLLSHLKRLMDWQKLGYFRYGGRIDEATVYFTGGLCPLFSQSSGGYNSLSAMVPFKLGVAALPLDTRISKQRHANVVGGAAIWAVEGLTNEQYKGIAAFFVFLAKPETQKKWHEHTGYLPLGLHGVYADILKTSQHPALLLAKTDLDGIVPQGNMVTNMAPMNQIRAANDELLEAMFAGLINPNEALHRAVARSNHLLTRFIRNTSQRLQKMP